MKEIAPCANLRKWFNHEAEKWREFKRRYFNELQKNSDAVRGLLAQDDSGRLTFILAKDRHYNPAVAL
jgi:uncharacterized protein YeaO (DUF488 family)